MSIESIIVIALVLFLGGGLLSFILNPIGALLRAIQTGSFLAAGFAWAIIALTGNRHEPSAQLWITAIACSIVWFSSLFLVRSTYVEDY